MPDCDPQKAGKELPETEDKEHKPILLQIPYLQVGPCNVILFTEIKRRRFFSFSMFNHQIVGGRKRSIPMFCFVGHNFLYFIQIIFIIGLKGH